MAATNPFRGMETDNPYKHIKDFTILCNTVRQEGVPDERFNLFPYSLADEAKTHNHLHPSKLVVLESIDKKIL
jgi:hypothetical protein